MKISDFLFGLLYVLLGASVLIYALSLPPLIGQRYGAGAFPGILGFGFVVGGIALTWRGYRAGDTGTGIIAIAPWVRDPTLLVNVLLALGAILGYVILDEYVGFVPLAFVILMTFFLRSGVPLLKSTLIAVLTIVFIQISFVTLLRVPLPRGILDSLLMW